MTPSSSADRARSYRDNRRGGPPREPAPCGTYAAYRRHQRNGETPCDECRRAYADYQRDLQRARRMRHSADYAGDEDGG